MALLLKHNEKEMREVLMHSSSYYKDFTLAFPPGHQVNYRTTLWEKVCHSKKRAKIQRYNFTR